MVLTLDWQEHLRLEAALKASAAAAACLEPEPPFPPPPPGAPPALPLLLFGQKLWGQTKEAGTRT